jgi:multidrug efflux pump
MLAVALLGWLSWHWMPVSALPQVDYPTIQVTSYYPGANASLMANTVIAPLERQLGQMPNLMQMSSQSSFGFGQITLRFGFDIPLDIAEQQVQAAINNAQTLLPADLPMPPIYHKVNPADAPMMTLAISSDRYPLHQLQDLVETQFASKLSQVSGVGLVSIGGSQRPALRIMLDASKLAALKLSPESIRTLINNHHLSLSKGSINGPQLSTTLDSNDQLNQLSDYQQLIVLYQQGAPIRLSDIANIEYGAENDQLAAWQDGKPALLLQIQRQPDANVIAVSDRIQRILPQLTQLLPADVMVSITQDRTQSIRASLSTLQWELMLAIVLVMLVMWLFLRRLKTMLIPALAIPLSLLGAIGVIYLLGYSINTLTLMALLIATGFVVDDAIVMVENISRHHEQGLTPLQAAIYGAQQMRFTIISLSLSLIAALIPILFMQDMLGRLFHEFAVTLAIAILISAVVSLSLTPMLAAYWLDKELETTPARWWLLFQQGYARLLEHALTHYRAMLVLTLILASTSVVSYVLMPKGFFPTQDTGTLMLITTADGKLSFSALAAQHQNLIEQLMAHPAVRHVSCSLGNDGQNAHLHQGRLYVQLAPLTERASLKQIQQQLQAISVPGLSIHSQPLQELTIEDQVTPQAYHLIIDSPRTDLLAHSRDQLLAQLSQLPALSDVQHDQQTQTQQLSLTLKRAEMARLSVSPKALQLTLYNALAQRQIATIFTESNQYRIVLAMQNREQQGIDSIQQLYVTNDNGQSIPLHQLVDISTGTAPALISRLDQIPSVTISFGLADGYHLGDAWQQIEQSLAQHPLDAGVDWHPQGALAAFDASLSNTLWLMLAAIISVYIILGILYESLIHPITILSTLLPAALGAFLALSWSGLAFDMMGVVGILLLIGIVKKNAIMMIDFALAAMREQGLSADAAIHQAAVQRLRPILMTTLATFFAALPLLLTHEVGFELRQPMGIALIGGLVLSQLITLFTTPALFLALERLRTTPNIPATIG